MNKLNCRSQKDNLKQAEAAEEQRLVRSQREYLELELRRFRRRRMLAIHHKEQELLRDVSIIVLHQHP